MIDWRHSQCESSGKTIVIEKVSADPHEDAPGNGQFEFGQQHAHVGLQYKQQAEEQAGNEPDWIGNKEQVKQECSGATTGLRTGQTRKRGSRRRRRGGSSSRDAFVFVNTVFVDKSGVGNPKAALNSITAKQNIARNKRLARFRQVEGQPKGRCK